MLLATPSVRQIAVVGFLGALTITGLALFLAYSAAQHARTAATHALQLEADAAAAEAERYLTERLATLEALAQSRAMHGTPEERQLVLDSLPGVAGFLNVSLIGPDGYVIAASELEPGTNTYAGDRDVFRDVMERGRSSVGSAVIGRILNVPVLPLGVPFDDSSTGATSVLAAAIGLGQPNTPQFGLAPSPIILGRSGRIIVDRDSPARLMQDMQGWANYQRVNSEERGLFRGEGASGEPDAIVAFAAVPAGLWVVLVEHPADAVFAEAGRRFLQEAVAIAVFFFTTLVSLILLTRRMEAYAQGEVDARARVEEELRAREQFVRSLVHDVRSPLTVIKGGAAFARRRTGAAQNSVLDEIDSAAARIDRMLTDMSLAEGQLFPEASEVNLGQLLDRVVRAAQADDRAREYILAISDEIVGWWDEGLLWRALDNLLSNSRKYSEPGTKVWVSAHRTNGLAEISVRDEGRGVRPEDLPHIFEPFRRGADSGGTPGMGLGLANVANIARVHEGTVRADSGPGLGTTITIRLPISRLPDSGRLRDYDAPSTRR